MTAPASAAERAVKDTAKQFGSQLLVGAAAVVFAAWLNRMLPARELAVWPLCVSLGGAISAVASLGMGDSFVRIIPALQARGQHPEAARHLKTGLLLNLVVCAALSVLIYFASAEVARYLLHDPKAVGLVRPMALAAFFSGLGERLNWAMQATQQFGKRALVNGIVGIIRTPLAVVLYLLMAGAHGVVMALTITPLLGCMLSVIWLWPHLRPGRGLAPAREVLAQSVPFWPVSLTSLICGRMNQLVIALFVAPEVLATYFVASSVAGYVGALDHFAVDVTTPKLSEKGALAGSIHDTERVLTKCTRYLFLGLTPLHLLVALAATPLLQLYGGSQYAHAGLVLALLCVGMLLLILQDVNRAHLVVFTRPRNVFTLSVINGVTNISLLLVLAPALGALGAALADLGVALVLLIASWALLRPNMRVDYDYRALVSATGATALGGVALWALHPLWRTHASGVLPALAAAGAVYSLAVARSLRPEDRQLVLQCLPGPVRQRLLDRQQAMAAPGTEGQT